MISESKISHGPLILDNLPKFDIDTTQQIQQQQNTFLQISQLLQNLDSYSRSQSIVFIEKVLSELCPLIASNLDNSNYCFLQRHFSTQSLMNLIEIYRKPKCTSDLRHYLTMLFIEATYHSQSIAELICQNVQTLTFLLDFFTQMKSSQKEYKEVSDLILNLSTCAVFYTNSSSYSLFLKIYLNAFPKKGLIDNKINEKYSRFLINFFRFGSIGIDIENPSDETVSMVTYLGKWFNHYTSGQIFKNLLWCVYFWFRNNPDFALILFQTPLWEIVIDQIKFDEDFYSVRIPSDIETQFKIALSICAMALHTDDSTFLRCLNEKFPLLSLVTFIDHYNLFIGRYESICRNQDQKPTNEIYFNETYRLAFIYCTNYASKHTQCVINLLECGIHNVVLQSFKVYPYDLRIEVGYLITALILHGDHHSQQAFCSTEFIQIFIELLALDDVILIARLLESLIILTTVDHSLIMESIDISDIHEIMDQHINAENLFSLGSELISRFDYQQ